ncbi:hypothetical protein BRD00_02025 [Halobacteriales archaeon QS_8_69_26]|nr:MAG: hypothetical protein BRD00_02025 [Halobacteriales archaeon QS_8_69_26]
MSFERRDLSADVDRVRAEHAPEALVLDADRDFETLGPDSTVELGVLVDSLETVSYPAEWFPDDAPEVLQRCASDLTTVGLPSDGSVTWTRQTDPPVVIVKPRVEGSPEGFVDFLVAEALVEVGLGVPEAFPGFFEDRYRDLDAAVGGDPAGTFQVAAALYAGWVGLRTREVFARWSDRPLAVAWWDAGERLEPRLSDLSGAVARGELSVPGATELACSALKHDVDVPSPFSALDTDAYRERGADFAVAWAEKTFEQLSE